jgi:hypothetical protein
MVDEKMFEPLFRGYLRLRKEPGAHLISISLIETLTAIRRRTRESECRNILFRSSLVTQVGTVMAGGLVELRGD